MQTKPEYEFENLVKKGIEKLGAKPDDYYQYKLLTKYGLLKNKRTRGLGGNKV